MSYVKQGDTKNLFATFQNVAGVETASSVTPTVTVIHVDAAGDTITDVNAQDMTLITGSTGQYYYAWTVDDDAYVGDYLVTYSGTVEGRAVSATESVSVVNGETDPSASTYYCNTYQMAKAGGIGVEVQKENLGTGDGSEDSYDTSNGNVLDNSYTISYGTTNDLTELVEDDDYSISLDDGSILLTVAGITKVNGKIIYIDYMYSPKQSDTILASYLPQINAEVDKLTGNYWGADKTSYQYFDGYTSGYPQTDAPYGEQIEDYPEFELKYKGISSITSIVFLDRQGNTDTTLESTQYRVITDDDYQDSRLLINTTLPNGKNNIKVTFISGYDSTPALVQELASYVGAMMALVNISGGSYKDVSTYSLGRKSFSIGQVYVNIESSIKQMKLRMDEITNLLGSNFFCV